MTSSDSKIYLDQQGNYRDKTPENLEAYPPAEDAAPEEAPAPDAGTADTDAGTELETGEDAPVAKTRKQS